MGTASVQSPVAVQTLAVAPVLALMAGGAAGAVAGGLLGVTLMRGASSSDEWAALGSLVAGTVLGVLVAGAVYVAALVSAARRVFPPGRRVPPVLVTLLSQAAVAAYGAALLAVIRPTSLGWAVLLMLLGAAAVACGPVAFVWSGTSGRPRRIAIAWLLTPTILAGLVVAGTNTVGEVRTARTSDDMPLVLFSGATADPAFPGWRRDRFTVLALQPARSFTDRGHEASLKYFTPAGVTFVTMHTDAGRCTTPAPGYTCAEAGRLPAGELRSYLRTTPSGSYPQDARYLVLMYPDGSAVSVNVSDGYDRFGGPTAEQALAVPRTLERVDRARFEDRTGSRLSLT